MAQTLYAAVHVAGDETIKHRSTVLTDVIDLEAPNHASGVTLVFPHSIPADQRRRLLLELASAANALAVQVTDEQVPA